MSTELVEKLKEGVTSCGMHDDNSTELFDIEEASETMAEAADLITELVGALRATTHEVEVVAALLYDESTRNNYIKIAADARAILAKATTHER